MCIFCIASDAIYNNNYTNNNTNTITITITNTITIKYNNKEVRKITGKTSQKPGLFHRLWKTMCTPLWKGCAQTVDYL